MFFMYVNLYYRKPENVQVILDVKRWYFLYVYCTKKTNVVCGQVGCWYGFIYNKHMPENKQLKENSEVSMAT